MTTRALELGITPDAPSFNVPELIIVGPVYEFSEFENITEDLVAAV